MGPMHSTMAHMSSSAGILPARRSTCSLLPTRSRANMPIMARPISARKYAEKPSSHRLPASMPKKGGNMTFPAPKNMENSAKPTTTISPRAFFFCPFIMVSPFLSCSGPVLCGAPQRAVRDAFPAYRVSFFSSLRK